MFVIIILPIVLVSAYVLNRVVDSRFTNEVNELFAKSAMASTQKFGYGQLLGLPEPVQRYFKYALKDGQPYINHARLTHNGQFKMGQGKKWANISGEQYFTTGEPGFVWKGRIGIVTAVDKYGGGKGSLVVSLFSLLKVVNGKGDKFNQGELLRWLGESVWFPTNLLPSKHLRWAAIDDQTASLHFNYNGLTLIYTVSFNRIGEITQMETKRYMMDKLETWVIKMTDYKELNYVMIPITAEALWKLESGDFSYARFHVREIEYDRAERF